MQNSDLIHTLSVLTKKELKQLHKFLLSPYFNENKRIVAFFEYLIDFAPNFTDPNLEKRIVFKYFFPEKNYEATKGLALRQLMSSLYKLIEKFITHSSAELLETQIIFQKNILDFYRRRGLHNQFKKQLGKWNKMHGNRTFYGHLYYYEAFLIQDSVFSYHSIRNIKNTCGEILQDCLHNLELFSLVSQLHYTALLLNESKIFNVALPTTFADALLKQVENGNHLTVPIIAIYYHAIILLQNRSEEHFFIQYKELLNQHSRRFFIYEARQLYVYAKNYCTNKIGLGNKTYSKDLFDLYQNELRDKIIYDDGKIRPDDFKNIITVSMVIGEIEWANTFLEDHRYKLIGKDGEEVYWYNKANILFYQKRYEDALEVLEKISFKLVLYKISAKRLIIKLYYEMDDIDGLSAAMNAFKVFIFRDEILSDKNKTRNRNFINLLYRIVNIPPKEHIKIDKLINQVKETKKLANRKWLLAKLEGLR